MPKRLTLNQFYEEFTSFKYYVLEKLEILEESANKIDLLYNAVDSFMGDIRDSREERIFINKRLDKHENRISYLEEFARKNKS